MIAPGFPAGAKFSTRQWMAIFRVQEALMSLLAGDVFRSRAVHARLLFFKAVYYFNGAFSFRKSLSAWRQRRKAAREAYQEPAAG